MLSTIVNVTIKGWFTGYKKLLVIILIMAISHPVSAQLLSPSKILLTFSEPMSRETIFDPDNYKVTANDNISVKVIKVGVVAGDSAVVLFIDKEDSWSSFKITVFNLKDKAGNLINAEKKAAEFSTILTKNNPVTVLDVK
ncbi:MAG: hypothetical protein IPI19_01785 [Ignavibacteriales bacterium]|nr:hypothetical protein [Ignavibacteriales bacterium]